MTPQELTALAKTLKLTPRRKAFCEILAADPERNQTRAMLAAGYDGNEGGAAVWASRTLRDAKIQKYLAALTEGATRKAERETGYRLASLSEALQVLTDQARARPTDFLAPDGSLDLEKVRQGPAGVISSMDLKDRKFKLESPQGAAEKLVRFHSVDPTAAAEAQRKMDRAARMLQEFFVVRPDVARDFHLFLMMNSEPIRVVGEGSAA